MYVQDNKNTSDSNETGAVIADNLLKEVNVQKLRNMRHKDLCLIEKGTVAIDGSKKEYSTVKIVNSALKHWYHISKEKKFIMQ